MVIRPADPAAHFPGIAALHSAYNPDFGCEPLTADRLLANERLPGRTRRQFVALAADGAVIGSAQALHGPWLPEGTFDITVLVDPAYRGQGAGSGLFRAARECVAGLGGTRVQTEIADDDAAALTFALRRGFSVGHHRFKSTLDVAAFVPFSHAVAGVRISEYVDTDTGRQRLYELHCRGELDEPSSTGRATPFEEYSRATFGRTDMVVFLAVSGTGSWVGLSQVEILPGRAHHELSCVDRQWRGLGIAQALKLHTIEYARAHGIGLLTTTNDSRNAAMLAINRKFGYRPSRGVLQLVAVL